MKAKFASFGTQLHPQFLHQRLHLPLQKPEHHHRVLLPAQSLRHSSHPSLVFEDTFANSSVLRAEFTEMDAQTKKPSRQSNLPLRMDRDTSGTASFVSRPAVEYVRPYRSRRPTYSANDLAGQANPDLKPPRTRLLGLSVLLERPGPRSKPGSFLRKSGSRPCGLWIERSLCGAENRVTRRRSRSWNMAVSNNTQYLEQGCASARLRRISNSDILGLRADALPRD